MSVDRLLDNAARLGHGAHVVALAGALTGQRLNALCPWCLQDIDPREELEVHRLTTARGECLGCQYVGPDVLLIIEEES